MFTAMDQHKLVLNFDYSFNISLFARNETKLAYLVPYAEELLHIFCEHMYVDMVRLRARTT